MKRVAFLTHRGLPALTSDDRAALEPLRVLGIEVEPHVWGGDVAELAALDAVVLRSCWDAHRRTAEFLDWLSTLQAAGARVLNPPDLVPWNIDKRYLLELERQGATIPATRVLERGAAVDPRALLDAGEGAGVVVKPAVSLDGEDTFRFDASAPAALAACVEDLVATRDVLVQAFVPEVATRGETSLVFFQGRYSHTVLKRPRAGEFRVQEEYGGSRARVEPTAGTLAEAARLLAMRPEQLLYARVDGVETSRGFVLMELELIDPMLFLLLDEAAPRRFAEALAEALTTERP